MNASEADIIFKKYDTNNDGVIDEEEAKLIQADYANKAEGYELLQKYVSRQSLFLSCFTYRGRILTMMVSLMLMN